jgi:hypothetical protein
MHAACVDEANGICCGWQYMFISFNMVYHNGMNYTKIAPSISTVSASWFTQHFTEVTENYTQL